MPSKRLPAGALLTLLIALFGGSTQASSPVELENTRAGTTDWRISKPAQSEIEGYASLTSVGRGDQISFFVNTAETSYTLEIFRLGWYGGLGGRRMTAAVTLPGVAQAVPAPNSSTGLVDCNWTNRYTVTTADPADSTKWLSGVYLAKLTGKISGKQRYIIFVVREDNRSSDLLYQLPVSTYAAYNARGGKSLYGFNSTNGVAAVKVSFNRPYDDGWGSGRFLTYGFRMVAFLEQQGYDVTYSTSVDSHESPTRLRAHKVFLSVGHDEYWSYQMRTNVELARDLGASLGFFSGNGCYWQIRFEPSPATGAADRVVVAYKDRWQEDPDARDPSTYYLVTTRWRDRHVTLAARPEDGMMGVMYNGFEPVSGDILISNLSPSWVYANTGLSIGNKLAGLLGYEVDRIYRDSTTPSNVQLVTESPYVFKDGSHQVSDMATYTSKSGSTVFAAGTVQWDWGLNDISPWGPAQSRVSSAARQITRNVIARLTATSVLNQIGSVIGISLRSFATGSTSTGDNHVTVNLPAGVRGGDFLLAEVAVRGGLGLNLIAPAGWTLVRRDNAGSAVAQAEYYHLVPASPAEPASYTWLFDAGNDAAAGIAAYAGVNSAVPIVSSAGQSNPVSTSITAPSVAGTAKALLVGLYAVPNGSTITLPSATTKRWSFRAIGYGVGVAMSDETLNSNNPSGSRIATAATAAVNVGALVVLKPQ